MENEKKIQIFGHQEKAFQRIRDIATVCFAAQRKSLPIKPRTNTLVIGPSGSGKTYLAKATAEEKGVAFLPLSISEWLLLGCSNRGGVTTWPAIGQFLLKHQNEEGVVIFLDELDKLVGESTWEAFLRTEIFTLLDLNLPSGLCDGDGCPLSDSDCQSIKDVLANRTMILGAGAFQELWDAKEKKCSGFGNVSESSISPSRDQLCNSLPRELVSRFRDEVLVLPQLGSRDYEEMLLRSTEAMPSYLQETFLELGIKRIEHAVESRQGCRFLEELLTDTLLAERAALLKTEPTLSFC